MAQHLRAFCQLRRRGDTLSFWRTRAGLEWILWCMAPSCLQAFGADYPEAERWLLSFTPEPLGIDGIRCEPLELWLQQLQVEPPG